MDSVQIEIEHENPAPLDAPLEPGSNSDIDLSLHMLRNLRRVYFKSNLVDGPGVVVYNDEDQEILRCPIPRLEHRVVGQRYAVNDILGNTVMMGRRGLQSFNITSGKGNVSLGRLKTPVVGRIFHFRSAFGVFFDIISKGGDIFCCPCCISEFAIVSHLDHQIKIGKIKFNRRNGICELDLSNEDLNLNEKTIALLITVGLVLFEWYFRRSEMGYRGQRGSICLLGYIIFFVLIMITVTTVFCISFSFNE